MKKVVLTLAVALLSTVAFSQVTFKPGVRAGVNLASIAKIDDDSRFGFYGGIFGELYFGGIYALQPEISFSQQGSKNVELDYLSITLANKFYPFKEDMPIFFTIGPSVDINLHGDTQSYSNSAGAGINFEADLSFIGGIGYSLPMGIDIEARFRKGIIDVFNDGDLSGRTNSVIQIGAAYKFDFSK